LQKVRYLLRDEYKAKNIKEYPKKGNNGEESMKIYFTFDTRPEAKAFHEFIRRKQNLSEKKIYLDFNGYFL